MNTSRNAMPRSTSNILNIGNWKLQSKIIGLVVLVVTLTVVPLAVFNYFRTSSSIIQSQGMQSSESGHWVITSLAERISGDIKALQAEALSPTVIEAVEQANGTYQGRSQGDIETEIATLDKAWKDGDPGIEPRVKQIADNPLSAYLKSTRGAIPEFVEIFVTDIRGLNVAMTDRTSDYFQADEGWWQSAYNNGQGAIYYSDVEYDESAKTWAMDIGVPIRDATGQKIIGIARGTIETSEIFSSIENAGVDVRRALLSREGTLLYTPESSLLMKPAPEEILALVKEGKDNWRSNVKGIDGSGDLVGIHFLDGEMGKVLGWSVITYQSMDQINAEVWNIQSLGLMIAGVIALLMVVVGLVLARSFTKPLGTLVGLGRAIAVGDVALGGVDEKEFARIEARQDDLGEIGKAFAGMVAYLKEMTTAAQHMAKGDVGIAIAAKGATDLLGNSMLAVKDNLAGLIDETKALTQSAAEGKLTTRGDAAKFQGSYREIVQGLNSTLDAVIEPVNDTQKILGEIAHGDLTVHLNGHYKGDYLQLKSSIESMLGGLKGIASQTQQSTVQMTSVTAQILASSTQMASSTREQASAVNEVTSTVREIKASAEQVAQRAQGVANSASQAVTAVEDGLAAVEEATAGMEDIRTKVEAIAENILALSEQTQQIGEIIDTVSDIAGQSNILALNAAIEAAQAGEAGKGFRVVADEVRTLAEQSRQAAAQVKIILNDIQKATNLAVMATEQGTKGVQAGSELVHRTAQRIQDLSKVVEQSASASQQIVAGVEQQTIGLDQIVIGMNDINQASQQTAEGATQSQRAAQDLNQLSEQLKFAAAQYRL